ncbi:MAG: GNAT family N-acetyltransferase [Beijerinckiaceae bacterium]
MPQHPAAFRLAPRRAGDLPDLVDLWVESWQTTMPHIEFEARRDWFRTHLLAMEADGALTICGFDADDRLAGFALLVTQKSYLEQIAVHPRHFGSGLAGRLLGEAKSLCPGGLTLDVNADNLRALRFYERQGFWRIAAGTNELSGLATWRLRWP